MAIQKYFVITAFVFLGIMLMVQLVKLHKQGEHFIGKPSIDKFNFYTAKTALFLSWGFFMIKAIFPDTGYTVIPGYLSWFAVVLLWFGAIITSLSFFHLGQSLKVGIPEVQTKLRTSGIYRFSRNPLYLGIFIISISSCIYFPDLVNITFVLFGIFTHHKIILAEENFLSGRFGQEWEDYRKRTGRYF